jgi:Tfp pilus assembly protein PilE
MLSKAESGITLLEVMLAVVIIAVFVYPLTASREDILAKAHNSNLLRTARMLACQKMEEFLLAQVSEATTETAQGGTFEKYPGFSWSQTTEDVSIISEKDREDNPEVIDIYVNHITITVEYENYEGIKKSQYSLSTILPSEQQEEGAAGGS